MEEFYVICDNIRSLENIGSIFRTADALRVNKIFLCGISGKHPGSEFLVSQENLATLHHKISKTALGAEKIIPFEYCSQTWRLIDRLKKEKVNIVSLEQNKKSVLYTKIKYKFPLAIILGNEVKGISKKILDKSNKIVYLPMRGQKESLNVSVAFGVAGYHINKFRHLVVNTRIDTVISS